MPNRYTCLNPGACDCGRADGGFCRHWDGDQASKLYNDYRALFEVRAERDRQDAKWGGTPGIDRRDDHTYAAVLGEEFGEVCKAWLERDMRGLREELIQVAAVAVAWVEEIDNGGAVPRPDLAPRIGTAS